MRRRFVRLQRAEEAANREAAIARALARREGPSPPADRRLQVVFQRAPKLANPRYAGGLSEIARLAWERTVEDWVPKGRAADRQLRSLVRHLVVRYPVPEFLYGSFSERTPDLRSNCVRLHVHLGRGGSMFAAVPSGGDPGLLPVPLTRRMCHVFLRSTVEHSLVWAVRRAQVVVHGGDERILGAIRGTFLGRGFNDREGFWLTVIQWLCQQAMLAPAQIGPIVDWVRFRAEADEAFSMKGRTGVSVSRDVARWHGELAQTRTIDGKVFAPSGFSAHYGERPVGGTGGARSLEPWCVVELLTSRDLRAEGTALRHCVASYAGQVEKGRCSIWSLRVNAARVLTIEVDNGNRRVAQVRGRANRLPHQDELRLIRQWAAMNGLLVGARASSI